MSQSVRNSSSSSKSAFSNKHMRCLQETRVADAATPSSEAHTQQETSGDTTDTTLGSKRAASVVGAVSSRVVKSTKRPRTLFPSEEGGSERQMVQVILREHHQGNHQDNHQDNHQVAVTRTLPVGSRVKLHELGVIPKLTIYQYKVIQFLASDDTSRNRCVVYNPMLDQYPVLDKSCGCVELYWIRLNFSPEHIQSMKRIRQVRELSHANLVDINHPFLWLHRFEHLGTIQTCSKCKHLFTVLTRTCVDAEQLISCYIQLILYVNPAYIEQVRSICCPEVMDETIFHNIICCQPGVMQSLVRFTMDLKVVLAAHSRGWLTKGLVLEGLQNVSLEPKYIPHDWFADVSFMKAALAIESRVSLYIHAATHPSRRGVKVDPRCTVPFQDPGFVLQYVEAYAHHSPTHSPLNHLLTPEQKASYTFMMQLVRLNPLYFQFASSALRKTPGFVYKAIPMYPALFVHVPLRMQKSPEMSNQLFICVMKSKSPQSLQTPAFNGVVNFFEHHPKTLIRIVQNRAHACNMFMDGSKEHAAKRMVHCRNFVSRVFARFSSRMIDIVLRNVHGIREYVPIDIIDRVINELDTDDEPFLASTFEWLDVRLPSDIAGGGIHDSEDYSNTEEGSVMMLMDAPNVLEHASN